MSLRPCCCQPSSPSKTSLSQSSRTDTCCHTYTRFMRPKRWKVSTIMDHDESERELHEDWSRPFKDSYDVMRAAKPYLQNMASARSSGAAGLPTCVIADMFCLWAQVHMTIYTLPQACCPSRPISPDVEIALICRLLGFL